MWIENCSSWFQKVITCTPKELGCLSSAVPEPAKCLGLHPAWQCCVHVHLDNHVQQRDNCTSFELTKCGGKAIVFCSWKMSRFKLIEAPPGTVSSQRATTWGAMPSAGCLELDYLGERWPPHPTGSRGGCRPARVRSGCIGALVSRFSRYLPSPINTSSRQEDGSNTPSIPLRARCPSTGPL